MPVISRPMTSTPMLRAPSKRALVAWALVAVAGGAAAWWSSEHVPIAIAILMVPVSLSPMIVRGIQGRWDPFELGNILAFTIFCFYALRPLAELHYGINQYITLAPRPGFVGAVGVAMIGAIAMYAGYALPVGRRLADKVPALPPAWDVGLSVWFAGGMLVLAAILTTLFAVSAGGVHFLVKYYSGRDYNTTILALRVPAYYYLGPYLTIPASVILAAAASKTRAFTHVAMLAVSVTGALLVTVPRGDRTFMLALLLPLVVLWFLHRGTRPRLVAMIATVLALMIPLNVLTEVRNTSTRQRGSVTSAIVRGFEHPTTGVKKFVTASDLSEFTSLEVEYQGIRKGMVKLHPGTTITSLIFGPVPRSVYKNKPKNGDQWVNYSLYPFTRQTRAGFGPGAFGDFFVDYAWVSLIAYGLLVGAAVRLLWEYFRPRLDNPGMRVVYCALMPLVVIMIRASVLSAVSIGAFLAFPLVFFLLACSRNLPPGARGATVTRS